MTKNIFYLLIACLLFISSSCNKDDEIMTESEANEPIPTNLKSVLSLESNGISVDEGKPIFINLNLTEAFSEDLILEGAFTHVNKASYMNEDDMKKEFSYSSDFGETWSQEPNKLQIKFPKGKKNLKVRILTTNDNEREILYEDIELTFSSKTTTLDIGEEVLNINLAIKDDDDLEDTNDGALMEFVFDNNNNYSIKAITNKVLSSESDAVKRVVDEEYIKVLDDIQYINSILPVSNRVKTFQLLFVENSGLGGYVFNNYEPDVITVNKNEWTMGMNVSFAYLEEAEGGSRVIDYNSNGIYGYILAHEVGHIITLGRKLQLDGTATEENCENFFSQEGCTLPNAHLNKFNSSFYANSAQNYQEPLFVSQYAKTNIIEDIAEVIGTYVAQDELPPLVNNSSGALNKLYQIFNENEFQTFRNKFRENIKIDFGLGSSAVEKSLSKNDIIFNVYKGKKVPCEHVKEAFNKEMKEKLY